MATSIGTITRAVSFQGTATSDVGHPDPIQTIREVLSYSYSNGVNAGQANKWFAITYTIVSAIQTIDFTGGLTDPYGNALTFTRIKELLFVNNHLTLAPAVSGNFMDALGASGSSIDLHPLGGIAYFSSPSSGYLVVNSTADSLAIGNDGIVTMYVVGW